MHSYSARLIHEHFLQKKLSAVSMTEKIFERIEQLDPSVGAFITLHSQRALDVAHKLDQKLKNGGPIGKLAAVPVGIKDNMHIKGEITTCASKFLSNYRAPFSATAVELLEQEDAILIGKLNMDEFGMGSSTEHSAYHLTKNPWDLNCVPGGSSGGSAAAVAARFCPIATATDTGGSIRQPAAFCGVVGFKPTYGRVSRHGVAAFGSSLDQVGPITHNVADAALVMEVIGKHCPKDSTSIKTPAEPYLEHLKKPVKGKKIGVPWHFLENLEKEAKNNFLETIEHCKSLGMEIIEVDLDILRYSIAVYYIIATAEASTNLARYDGILHGKRSPIAETLDEVYELSKQEGFGAEVKNRIMLGTYVLSSGYQDEYYNKAQQVRTLIIEKYRHAFQQCDVIAMPVSPFPAFPLNSIQDPLQMYLSDIYTVSINLAGLPAISIPSGFSQKGRPFAIQFIGAQMHDSDVLCIAAAFEKQSPQFFQVPPQFGGV